MAAKGRSLVIQAKLNGNDYVTVAGMRSKTITVNNETVDSTTDDSLSWRELEGDIGTRTLSISGSAVFKDDLAMLYVETLSMSGNPQFFKVNLEEGKSIEGNFIVSSFEHAGEHNDLQMASFTLESAGAGGNEQGEVGIIINIVGECSLTTNFSIVENTPAGNNEPFYCAPEFDEVTKSWMAVTRKGIVYTSENLVDWTKLPTDNIIKNFNNNVNALTSAGNGIWLAVGDYLSTGKIWKTVDGGLSWSEVYSGGTSFVGIDYLFGNKVMAIGSAQGHISNDLGNTWGADAITTGSGWRHALTDGVNIGVISSGGRWAYSTDGGDTFTNVLFFNAPANQTAIYDPSIGKIIIGGSAGNVYIKDSFIGDGLGVNKRQAAYAKISTLTIAKGIGIIAGCSLGLYTYSTDGGETWTDDIPAGFGSIELFISGNSTCVVGSNLNTNGVLFRAVG